MYVTLHEVTWCMVVWCTQNVLRQQQFHVLPAMPALTLQALLSGTFLQTLPDLVMPLKGHSLSPRSCPQTGTNMTVEAA